MPISSKKEGKIMQSASMRINHLLEHLEEEDYDRVISYIEFLIDSKRKEQMQQKKAVRDKADVEAIVDSLTGVLPDTGKTLEEYRNERLKKYENPD